MKTLADTLYSDREIQEYIRIYMEDYGKIPPPLCPWEGETIDEYREKLRKLVEQEEKQRAGNS